MTQFSVRWILSLNRLSQNWGPVHGKPLRIYDDLLYIKLGGKETGGRYSLIEDVTVPGGGTPLHVHHREDESFYVLEGDYLFEANGKRFEVHAGDFVFAPRDVPHRFRNIGTRSGTMLLTLEPAGLELFFEELAAVTGPPDPVKVAPIFEKYGLELLGPPLADG
jgi:mannose-6-phosphate isomerase-like protein (cupin superfamily)